jgi:hypothetical protein
MQEKCAIFFESFVREVRDGGNDAPSQAVLNRQFAAFTLANRKDSCGANQQWVSFGGSLKGSMKLPPASERIDTRMEIDELAQSYRVKTEDELLRLKVESDQLTPEAREQLNRELDRRGINIVQGVDDPWRDTRLETGNRRGSDRLYALFPSLRPLFATLRDWKQYKSTTGKWPAASIGFYVVHGIFLLGWAASFIWFAVVHEWSRTKTILIILPPSVAGCPLGRLAAGKDSSRRTPQSSTKARDAECETQ